PSLALFSINPWMEEAPDTLFWSGAYLAGSSLFPTHDTLYVVSPKRLTALTPSVQGSTNP
ncbi:MAG: hypothetical protein JWN14_92, partial [Chthonomonadales bacterium]|nr:hypothetical protein [Chthonomonadales bacterium]